MKSIESFRNGYLDYAEQLSRLLQLPNKVFTKETLPIPLAIEPVLQIYESGANCSLSKKALVNYRERN